MDKHLNWLVSQDRYDGGMSVALVDYDMSLREILRELGCSGDNNADSPDGRRARRYVGSGTWTWYRTPAKSLRVMIDVGCHCEHDCCGHLCGLDYEILQSSDGWAIIKTWARNY